MTLLVTSGAHALRGVYVAPPQGAATPGRYRLADYDALRRLPLPGGGSRSLFGPQGLVAGTQRGERFLLWPMGIPAPGAMRQWGHYATAFVGRRHFDEPFLLERYFRPGWENGGASAIR